MRAAEDAPARPCIRITEPTPANLRRKRACLANEHLNLATRVLEAETSLYPAALRRVHGEAIQ